MKEEEVVEESSEEVKEEAAAQSTTEEPVLAGVNELTNTAVAKIGDVEYATLAEAFSAAKSGETVLMGQDIALKERLSIPDGVTLDGGNHTLTCSEESDSYYVGESSMKNASSSAVPLLQLDSNVTATIQNLTLETKAYARCNVSTGDGSSLTLDNVKLIHVEYSSRGNDALQLNGTLTVKNSLEIVMGSNIRYWKDKNGGYVENGFTNRAWGGISGNSANCTINFTEGSSFSLTDNQGTSVGGEDVYGQQQGAIHLYPDTWSVVTGWENLGLVKVYGSSCPYYGFELASNTRLMSNYPVHYTVGSDTEYFGTLDNVKTVHGNLNTAGATINVDPTDILAEGYTCVKDETEDIWTIQELPVVAKIGDVKYYTIAGALAAVPNDGTQTEIDLIADIGTEGAYAEFASVYANTIAKGQNVVLDLNGHNVYAKTTVNGETCYLRVENGGKLTINDSSESKNGGIYYLDGNDNTGGFVICSAGELVLNAGTLENKTECINSSIQGAVDVHANEWGDYYTANTTFTMNGGTLKSYKDNTLRLYDSSQTGSDKVNIKANISGGTITGKDAVFVMPQGTNAFDVSGENTHYMNNITLTVTGGIFTTTNGIRVAGGVTVANSQGSKPIQINVLGGTFNTTDTEKYRVDGVAFQETAGWTSTEASTANLRSYTDIYNTDFYKDEKGVYHIASLAGLKKFRDKANTGALDGKNETGGHTQVVLDADIDLNNEEWTPINVSCVDFDGKNHTISNLKVTTEAKNVGFFGAASISTVQNLTIDGATVKGINHVAAIAGDGLCGHFINCTVKNASITTFVKDNDDGDKAGAICGYLSGESDAEVTNCTAENVTVTGYRDIGGLVGIANGTASVTGNIIKNSTVVNERKNNANYKNYTKNSEYDIGKVVGETNENATVNNNTDTDNVVIQINADAFAIINGTTYYSMDDAKTDATYTANNGFITGTFREDVSGYCADDYTAYQQDDGWYLVKARQPIVVDVPTKAGTTVETKAVSVSNDKQESGDVEVAGYTTLSGTGIVKSITESAQQEIINEALKQNEEKGTQAETVDATKNLNITVDYNVVVKSVTETETNVVSVKVQPVAKVTITEDGGTAKQLGDIQEVTDDQLNGTPFKVTLPVSVAPTDSNKVVKVVHYLTNGGMEVFTADGADNTKKWDSYAAVEGSGSPYQIVLTTSECSTFDEILANKTENATAYLVSPEGNTTYYTSIKEANDYLDEVDDSGAGKYWTIGLLANQTDKTGSYRIRIANTVFNLNGYNVAGTIKFGAVGGILNGSNGTIANLTVTDQQVISGLTVTDTLTISQSPKFSAGCIVPIQLSTTNMADDCVCVQKAENQYEVKLGAAKVDGVTYATLGEAIEKLDGTNTLELVGDPAHKNQVWDYYKPYYYSGDVHADLSGLQSDDTIIVRPENTIAGLAIPGGKTGLKLWGNENTVTAPITVSNSDVAISNLIFNADNSTYAVTVFPAGRTDSATVTISGCSFTSGKIQVGSNVTNGTANVTVTENKTEVTVDATNPDELTETTTVNKGKDATFKTAYAIATVGSERFSTLAEAYAIAVTYDKPIVLIADADADAVTVEKNVELQLNGHKLTIPELKGEDETTTIATITVSSGTLTITNKEETGGIDVEGLIAVNGGTLNITTLAYGTGGILENKPGTMRVAEGATVKLPQAFVTLGWTMEMIAKGNLKFLQGVYGAKAVLNSINYVCVVPGTDDVAGIWVKEGSVARIGYTGYKTLGDAIDAAKAGDTINLLADIELSATQNISKEVTIDGNNGTSYTIKAGNSFTGTNLIEGTEGAAITLKNVTVDANAKCRAIKVADGSLTIEGATIKNGKLTGTNYAPGVFMTGTSTFVMNSGSITGNTCDKTDYLQYANDLWIGSQAKGTISGGTVGNVFVNSNEYSGSEKGLTQTGGIITNVFVEWDGDNKAAFTYTNGTCSKVIVAADNADTHKYFTEYTPATQQIYEAEDCAKINDSQDRHYSKLSDAVNEADTNAEIYLLKNQSTERINLTDKSITVKLNGYTLTGTSDYGVVFCPKNGNTITIDGTTAGSKIIGTIMCTSNTYGNIVVDGGTYQGNGYTPFYINGSASDSCSVTISNATITANSTGTQPETNHGLYLAGKNTTVLTNCTITGANTGLEVRAGDVTLTNCTVNGNADPAQFKAEANGSTVNGAAIAVSQHTTDYETKVKINSGTYTGVYAIYEKDLQNTTTRDVISLDVKDGNFKGSIYSDNCTGFITGGMFTAKPDEKYIANGYEAKEITGSEYTYKVVVAESKIDTKEVTGDTEGSTASEEKIEKGKDEVVNDIADNFKETSETDIQTEISPSKYSQIDVYDEEEQKEKTVDFQTSDSTRIDVKLDTVKITVDSSEVVEKGYVVTTSNASYDVKPVAIITTTDAQGNITKDEFVITNNWLKEKNITLKFTLPVPKDLDGYSVLVTHTMDNEVEKYTKEVKETEAGNRYVEITATAFSNFTLSAQSETNSAAMIVRSGKTYYYPTVQNAIDNAVSDDTITMLQDSLESLTVASGKAFTLDMNGHKLTASYLVNKGNLTIQDSKVSDAKEAMFSGHISNRDSGKVTIISGNFRYEPENEWIADMSQVEEISTKFYQVTENEDFVASVKVNNVVTKYTDIQDAVNAAYNDGTVKVLQTIPGAYIDINTGYNVTIDLNGKTLGGANDAAAYIANRGTLTLTDSTGDNGIVKGEIETKESGTTYIDAGCYDAALSGSGTYELSGGKYTKEPTAAQCAPGYGTYKNTDPTYQFSVGITTYVIETETKCGEQTSIASATGGGEYLAGSEVTLTAYNSTGYIFDHWELNGATVSQAASYTFTATTSGVYTAIYNVKTDAYFSLNINAAQTTVKVGTDAETKEYGNVYNRAISVNKQVTVTYELSEGETFIYWATESGAILTKDKTYTFTMNGNKTLVAYTTSNSKTGSTVVYTNGAGQVISSRYYASGTASIEQPRVNPTIPGYTFNGWKLEDGSEANSDTIKALLGTKAYIEVTPSWQKITGKIVVTVYYEGVSQAKEVTTKDANTLTTISPSVNDKEGAIFDHWEIDDEIVGYNRNYTLYSSKDVELTAVYSEDGPSEEKPIVQITNLTSSIRSDGKYQLITIMTINMPADYTLVQKGVIDSKVTDDITRLTIEGADDKTIYNDVISGEKMVYTFTLNTSNPDSVWNFRAYVTCKDSSNNLCTVYSDVQSASYNQLTGN